MALWTDHISETMLQMVNDAEVVDERIMLIAGFGVDVFSLWVTL
jgi:hypothetical protein